jgi:hypothetical protein
MSIAPVRVAADIIQYARCILAHSRRIASSGGSRICRPISSLRILLSNDVIVLNDVIIVLDVMIFHLEFLFLFG